MEHYETPRDAAAAIAAGGVIAYPTEAVYGLGCDPADVAAVDRILQLKGRPQQKGMICVAASVLHIRSWLADGQSEALTRAQDSWPGPVTWVFRASSDAPAAICQPDQTVAIRVTDHPLVTALCEAFGGPIVSTSANPAGDSPALTVDQVTQYFGGQLDGVLRGELGANRKPSEIRDAATGDILRAG